MAVLAGTVALGLPRTLVTPFSLGCNRLIGASGVQQPKVEHKVA